MKKLMMFAAAVTIVGSAFAEIAAYDYKASVKNVNLKTLKFRDPVTKETETVLVKFVQSTSLYGYLIQDCDNCDSIAGDGAGVLVLANKADKAKVPVIQIADLEVKIWNPKIVANKSWDAEGYLYSFGTAGSTSGLFGLYNAAEWVDDDSNPTTPMVPGGFYDTWLDASGFGKAPTSSSISGGGCGETVTEGCAALDTLAGSVIGGMFLCHPNGYEGYEAVSNLTLCQGFVGDVITGTWSIKRNAKFVPDSKFVADSTISLGAVLDTYVSGAIKAINSSKTFAGVVSESFKSAFDSYYAD